MRQKDHWWLIGIFILSLFISGCERNSESAEETIANVAKIEPIPGTNLNRVTLTEEGATSIDIQTLPVRETNVKGVSRKVIPYSSVLYGLHGETWVYMTQKPLIFERTPINIETISDNFAVLIDGPPIGTLIVTTGASELYGAEYLGTIQP